MQYFFYSKNRIQFDPIVNIVSNLAARSIIKKYITKGTEEKEDSLKKRMRSILSNKRICSKKEGLTYMDKTAQGSYVEALRGSTHFIRLANEVGLCEKK